MSIRVSYDKKLLDCSMWLYPLQSSFYYDDFTAALFNVDKEKVDGRSSVAILRSFDEKDTLAKLTELVDFYYPYFEEFTKIEYSEEAKTSKDKYAFLLLTKNEEKYFVKLFSKSEGEELTKPIPLDSYSRGHLHELVEEWYCNLPE